MMNLYYNFNPYSPQSIDHLQHFKGHVLSCLNFIESELRRILKKESKKQMIGSLIIKFKGAFSNEQLLAEKLLILNGIRNALVHGDSKPDGAYILIQYKEESYSLDDDFARHFQQEYIYCYNKLIKM